MLLEKVRQTIQKLDLIPANSTIVVAVSGGADSLALLHILHTLASRMRFHLHVATLDHGLRGEAGAADAQFVAEQAKALNIPFTQGRVDVKALANTEKLGIEAAARKGRYSFLAEVTHQQGAAHIATAHHADDQAETILMHLLRGSGLQGLRGMSVSTSLPGNTHLTLIRPFLHITRREIEVYCVEHGLHPREDATNSDMTLLRNRLRHEVLPYLEQINPQIRLSLSQVGDIASIENDHLENDLLHYAIHESVVDTSKRVKIAHQVFQDLHPAFQRRWVLWAAKTASPDTDQPSYQRVIEAVALAITGKHGAIGLLGNGIRLRVDYSLIVVERETACLLDDYGDEPLLLEGDEIPIVIPGETTINERWQLCAWLGQPEVDSTGIAMIRIPPKATVTLRTRREGDRFALPSMGGKSRKLNRWMIDRKTPLVLRDKLPMLIVNGEIAAIRIPSQWIVAHGYNTNLMDKDCVYFHFRENL